MPYSSVKLELKNFKSTEDLLNKFKFGNERYLKSVLFNHVIQMLIRGADPILIIDQLIEMNDDTHEKLKEYMIKAQMPSIIVKDKNSTKS